MTTIIKDVIYGFIQIPPLFKKIIVTAEFNRLRRIKQLGLASYVYPSANHTRFEHSIGVFHLAGKVCDKLGILEREKIMVQTAGLLHDVGHIAFSHLTDYILEEKKVDKKLSKHENRSILLLEKINKRLAIFSEDEIKNISDMILGNFENKEKPFLFQIVCNKLFGIDVDRLDYLQRDMYYTNMPCFQPNYLLECIATDKGHLAFLEKAFSEIKMMYEARKRLFTLVYRHKTVLKVECIIKKCMESLNLCEQILEEWESFDDYKTTFYIMQRCPELFFILETRDFQKIDMGDLQSEKFKHVKYIEDLEIENEIKKVNFLS